MRRYSDYVRTPSGLQYQDLREGTGKDARQGAQVTVDWDGYTIGYYGRPFEARNKERTERDCCSHALDVQLACAACGIMAT